MTTSKPRLNVQRLVQHLGGPAELHRVLNKKGYQISLKGIHMWVNRRSIPSPWLATLQKEFETHKTKRFAMSDFLDPDPYGRNKPKEDADSALGNEVDLLS